eukprot:3917403-Amphidinium_carterae.1
MMLSRRIAIRVRNFSEHKLWTYSGEHLDAGAWVGNRIERIQDEAVLEFENNSWFDGVAGYVCFETQDMSLWEHCSCMPRRIKR